MRTAAAVQPADVVFDLRLHFARFLHSKARKWCVNENCCVYRRGLMRCLEHTHERSCLAAARMLTALIGLNLVGPAVAAERIEPRLWRKPGRIEALDMYHGPGGLAGTPRPPFTYIGKNPGGTSQKVIVRDSRNRIWDVKFGDEVKAEVFATRIAWALGYYADPTYFVRRGRLKSRVFRDARFELRDPHLQFLPDLQWTWKKNPFVGTRQLNGLRVLIMLLSDWDNKDGREFDGNTGVLQNRRAGAKENIYFVTDWGASMGRWGGFFTREKWSCENYAEQSPKFVRGVDDGEVEWGFKGQHSGEFKDDISIADVRWLMTWLGRLRDSQIRSALRAAGATPHETRCFTTSLRRRINQLRRVSEQSSAPRPAIARRRL
jgi:hypothetical protein